MVSMKKLLRHSIESTASTISAPIAIPVKSNLVIQASRSVVDADSPVSIHTSFFKQSILRKSTRSTASTDQSAISSPVVVNQTSGTSGAVTSAESLDLVQSHLFVQPDQFQISLGSSTDHSIAASMVIAHEVERYTGKASLYAWNSFIPEDVSSVLVDIMAHLVMNSYPSFPGLIELIVPPEMIIPYGSLSRPPESSLWFAAFSFLTIDTVSGMIFVDSRSICHGHDVAAFWPSLERRYAHREGELMLSNLTQNHDCGDAGVMLVDIIPAFWSITEIASSLDMAFVDVRLRMFVIDVTAVNHVLFWLRMVLLLERLWLFIDSSIIQKQKISPEDFLFHTKLQLISSHVLYGVCSSTCILLQHSAVLQPPPSHIQFGLDGCKHTCTFKKLNLKCGVFVCRRSQEVLTNASWELDWFSNLQHHLQFQMIDYVVLFIDNHAALVYHEVQWQHNISSISLQGQSRDFDVPCPNDCGSLWLVQVHS